MCDGKANDENLNRLAYELFHKFARVEYALKRAGFHYGEGTDAKVNWDVFANTIQGTLESNTELIDAIAYMRATPPKKQVVRGGTLDWESPPPHKCLTNELILCVRRVRNNLFHGGKFNGRWFAEERSEMLLTHSLAIIDGCLQASPEVKRAFDND